VVGKVAQFFDIGSAGLNTVHAVLVERRVALAGEDVLPVVFLDRLLEKFLGLWPAAAMSVSS
jgi:hypothetical protein